MEYLTAFAYLQQKAQVQGRFRGDFRTRENLHNNYAIHLHGTHVWVSKQEWDKLNKARVSSRDHTALDPASYKHTSPIRDETHTYAIPVPGTPVMLRVYQTDVATFNADGRTTLAAGGYQGYVTGKWLDMVKHVRIRSIRMDKWSPSKWGLTDTAGTLTQFYDGLTLDKDGKIISEVQPFVKHVVDRSKSKPWHDAVRHFRDLVEPFVAMLDETEAPAPVLEAMKQDKTTYDSKTIAERIMARPQEIDPVLTTLLCMQSWYGYSPAAWASNGSNHIVHHAMIRFESRLRTVGREWTKANALKET
jgi:hypothetical protein